MNSHIFSSTENAKNFHYSYTSNRSLHTLSIFWQVEYLDATESGPVKFVNIVQTPGPIETHITEDGKIVNTSMTAIEDANGERQIIQVIREPLGGEMAIAAGKGDDNIYEFDQPQYIEIPNNALSNIQVYIKIY